jgi:hypothetical protein
MDAANNRNDHERVVNTIPDPEAQDRKVYATPVLSNLGHVEDLTSDRYDWGILPIS